MLEGTANSDGELKGTELELSPLDIYLESVSFSYIGMKNEKCN